MMIDFRLTLQPKEMKDALTKGFMRGYQRVYPGIADYVPKTTVEDLIRSMDEGGCDAAILQAEWVLGDYHEQNNVVYRAAKAYPKRFPATCMCLNPLEDEDMVTAVEQGAKEQGFKGINIQAFAPRVSSTDPRMWPVYAKCQELGLIVTVHTSISFNLTRPIEYSHPRNIDQIACDFPELIVIANHGGWPWVNEMVAIAWKHPNVYIETGAVSPKYIGTRGTGWDPLMVYGNSLLQDQVLFATDNIVSHKRCRDEINALPLKETVKKKWLGENAAKLLKLMK